MKPPAAPRLESSPSWIRAVEGSRPGHLAELFEGDAERSRAFTVEAGELVIDFSRQKIDEALRDGLVAAAGECAVADSFAAMRSGEPINSTEGRSVGHMALRMRPDEKFVIDGVDVVPVVHETLQRMSAFSQGVRAGTLTGSTGRSFTTVVNIGIGGSDLGPRLVHGALSTLRHPGISCRFVANVDPEDLDSQLDGLDPERTLFIVSSKTFTTVETLINARRAVNWIRSGLGDEAVSQHVVAVSADERAVRASGLGAGIVFPMWNWVGGRYSLGSAVGLSAMISIGPNAFEEILAGMRDLDQHVQGVPPSNNAPLLMALLAIWNHAALGCATRAVIPYSHGLRLLPAYLQQLMMESNGKSIRSDGTVSALPTSAVIWGDVGTNAQHAFMQQLHQGTAVIPVDFIGFAQSSVGTAGEVGRAQRILFTNMIAQAQALAFGRHHDAPHRSFAGDRPSTIILAPALTPRVLGQIIGLYEHAVFYEGALLGINSFDQWGVELGKSLASDLLGANQQSSMSLDAAEESSRRLLEWFDDVTGPKRD